MLPIAVNSDEYVQGGPKKYKPLPNEIKCIPQIKVLIKHCHIIRWYEMFYALPTFWPQWLYAWPANKRYASDTLNDVNVSVYSGIFSH